MRLILMDRSTDDRFHFYPLALSRPIFELRCGFTSLAEKWIHRTRAQDVAFFVPPYLADPYRQQTDRRVNDPQALSGDDLLLVDGRVKAGVDTPCSGPSQGVYSRERQLCYAWIAQADLSRLNCQSLDALLASLPEVVPAVARDVPVWNYVWELVLANAEVLAADFAAAGRSGIEGTVEQPFALRGSQKDVYIAPSANLHPMTVIDAEHGPVYIDEGAQIHPFTRIEGPCYIGKDSILLGAKCRAGNSIGPVCRIGGEIEESIIQGYSNKYHDGFLGHAYVGEWVNLGALTTNSDLKNDYSTVTVTLDGRTPIDTGSTKVGSLIGDHTKTSIGTLFNTGAYVGAMAVIAGTGKPLPKYIPCFAWFLEGVVTKGFGKRKLFQTASTVMARRGRQWTAADEALWDTIYEMTAPERDEAIKRGRRMVKK